MLFFRVWVRATSLFFLSFATVAQARLLASDESAYAGDLPPAAAPTDSLSQFVRFQFGLGYNYAKIPAAPGPIEEVSQNFYEVRLHLALPVWESGSDWPQGCFELPYASRAFECGSFSAQTLLGFGGEVLYPSTVKIEPGQASSMLRFFPQLVQNFVWTASPFVALEFGARLGWAYEKNQYGSTALVISAPRTVVYSRLALPGLRLWGGVPGVSAHGTVLAPLFRYSTNKDDTPLEASSGNITLLSSSFAGTGKGYRWSVGAGLDYTFVSGESALRTTLLYQRERGRFDALRKTSGYRTDVTDGSLAIDGLHLVVSRSL